jgi:hypothetical protein
MHQLPPISITGANEADWIIFGAGLVAVLYWFRALRLAREGARGFLRKISVGVLTFVIVYLILTKQHLVMNHDTAMIVSLISALVSFSLVKTRRTRYISKRVRREVIERDLKGESYDSSKHHIDHVWPYSKGGSNTADNLRVIEKRKNLAKGAKRPRLGEMW